MRAALFDLLARIGFVPHSVMLRWKRLAIQRTAEIEKCLQIAVSVEEAEKRTRVAEYRAGVAEEESRAAREYMAQRVKEETRVIFRRTERAYAVTVQFDPRVVGYGSFGRSTMELLAECVCDDIRATIVTAKFVRAAEDQEERERFPGWKP